MIQQDCDHWLFVS